MKDAHLKAASELRKGEKQIANLTLWGYAKEDSYHICDHTRARARTLASVQVSLNFLFLWCHCCRVHANPAFLYVQTPALWQQLKKKRRRKKVQKCERILLVERVMENRRRIIFTGQTSSQGSGNDSGVLCSSGRIHLSVVRRCLNLLALLVGRFHKQ